MTNIRIIVAGPSSLDELPEPVLHALELGRVQWLDVEDALQWLADAPARTTVAGARAADAHLWWFYRAPWDAGPEGTYADPAVWLGGQRRFLRSRLRAAGRVSTWNLSRPAELMPPEPRGLLPDADADGGAVARSTHPTDGRAGDADFVHSASGPTDALGGLIAHVIALAFPACWDVFEALEGLAPHATPGLASREELPAPSTEALAELTRRLNSAREVADMAARRDELLQRAEAAEHALREEAGLRGRLESESRLAAARAAAEAAELHAALASARDETQTALQQALSIGAERDTAKQALAGAQSALDQATRQLADAHSAHAQALAQLTQDAAALTAERDQSRQALEAAQAQLKESKEEGELLLLQLHQVQEELEQLFLQGKDKDTAYQKAQSDAKAALEKANQATKQAADQAAKALAGAKADHDKALAEAQAQIKARTTERDAKAKELADARTALDQAAKALASTKADHDKALAEAQAQIKARTTERDAKAKELADARTALDQAAKALAGAKADHDKALAEAQAQIKARTTERDAEAKELADAQAQMKDRSAERDQACKALEAAQAQLKESKEEGELLLLQLHQVQEELEQLFLQGKEKDTAHQKAQSDAKAALEKANQAAKQAADQAAKALAGAKADHDKALAEAQAQIKVRTTERDAKAKDVAEAQAQLSQRTGERDQARGALEAAQAQLKESQEEGELLLLQLHQVQEELETHFLRGKDLEQELQQMRRRHERMQRRHPEAVDVDAIEIAEVDASAAVPLLTWRLKGLSVQGRIWPELTLKATLGPNGFGLQLDAPAGSALAGCMDRPLVPKALVARDTEQVTRFRKLGASAWRCLVTACAAADEALATPSLIESLPAGFDAVFWKQALGPAAPVLRALPPAFRHDGVRLKREKVNPDYEHLWLVFEGASYGDREMPAFEMRLGAAQTQPGKFSQLPKLEFPLAADGQKPFEGWFEESHDDYGPKFELRADLSRQAFDLAVWAKLPKPSQALLLSFIAVLPTAVESLRASGKPISRSWQDWQSLSKGVIDVMRLRLAPQNPGPMTARPPQATSLAPPSPSNPPGRREATPPAESASATHKPTSARADARIVATDGSPAQHESKGSTEATGPQKSKKPKKGQAPVKRIL
jgi:hypothetical protein